MIPQALVGVSALWVRGLDLPVRALKAAAIGFDAPWIMKN
jgi:hypothetical protein